MVVKRFGERSDDAVVLCLGGFDSLHYGHKSVINKGCFYKKELSASLAVTIFSFRAEVPGGKNDGEVFTFDERLKILEELNIDEVIAIDFTKEFAKLSAKDFLDELCDNRPIAKVLCGMDFKFGFNCQGDVQFLKEYFNKKCVEVEVLPFELDCSGNKISTSGVKKALSVGDVSGCKRDFGVYYFISGRVEQGRRDGRKLGFPTANVIPPSEKYLLKSGVYACTVSIDGKTYRAISNLGDAPTFGVKNRLLECHIDGFSGDLYKRNISVYFDDRIRDIVKFDNIESLVKQLEKDLQVIR